jgi:hypothetical protein
MLSSTEEEITSTEEQITNLSRNLDEIFKYKEPRYVIRGCSNLNGELHLAKSIQSYINNGGSLEKNFIKQVFASDLTRSDNPSFFGATVEDNPVIKLLIDKINLDIPVDSHLGEKIIHLASRLGKTKIVEAFLDRGVNIDEKTDKGETPLHLAIELDREETIKFLIERGADVNAKTIEGKTPLHSKKCGKSIAQDLINAGADINEKIEGKTLLHLALENYQNFIDTEDRTGKFFSHKKFTKLEFIDFLIKNSDLEITRPDGLNARDIIANQNRAGIFSDDEIKSFPNLLMAMNSIEGAKVKQEHGDGGVEVKQEPGVGGVEVKQEPGVGEFKRKLEPPAVLTQVSKLSKASQERGDGGSRS